VTVTDLRAVSGPAPAPLHDPVRPDPAPAVAVYVLDSASDPDSSREQLAALGASFPVVLVAADAHTAADIAREIADGRGPASFTPRSDPGIPPTASADLVVDAARHETTWRGRSVPLTRREREILHCLLETPRRVWSHGELHERAWGGAYLGDPSLLHSALKRLRRKLRDSGAHLRIDAVRGVGFRISPFRPPTSDQTPYLRSRLP
jgi:hypothetical protein